MVQILGGHQLLAQQGRGLVVDARATLLQDHVALRIDVLVGQVEIDHPVRFHRHHQLQPVLGDHLEVGGQIVAGHGVVVAALASHDLGELAGRDLARALEHQMLEKVRQAGLARRAVGGADLVPDPMRHHRRAVVLDHHHLQAVVERRPCGDGKPRWRQCRAAGSAPNASSPAAWPKPAIRHTPITGRWAGCPSLGDHAALGRGGLQAPAPPPRGRARWAAPASPCAGSSG